MQLQQGRGLGIVPIKFVPILYHPFQHSRQHATGWIGWTQQMSIPGWLCGPIQYHSCPILSLTCTTLNPELYVCFEYFLKWWSTHDTKWYKRWKWTKKTTFSGIFWDNPFKRYANITGSSQEDPPKTRPHRFFPGTLRCSNSPYTCLQREQCSGWSTCDQTASYGRLDVMWS